MSDISKFRLVPDWSLPEDGKVKEGNNIRIHPHALISYAQKKWGVEEACRLASTLMKSKYDQKFDNVEITYTPSASDSLDFEDAKIRFQTQI